MTLLLKPYQDSLNLIITILKTPYNYSSHLFILLITSIFYSLNFIAGLVTFLLTYLII